MSDLVVNEWLWSDLLGENEDPKRRQSLRFLEALTRKPDRLIVVKGSGFDSKAWRLCKLTDPFSRQVARVYVASIRLNSDKCLELLQPNLPPIEESLASFLKQDDHYLVQAQHAIADSRIITTDRPLKEGLDRFGIPCEFRDEFLRSYLAQE